jgi:Tfp pilus assembly protein PilF
MLLWVGLAVFLVAVIAGTVYWQTTRKPTVDQVALLHANNVGVGYMEKFDYRRAVEAFEKVVAMDPGWVPGRVNLGIALLNQSSNDPKLLPRSQQVFQDILKEHPDNPYANYCLGIIYYHISGDEAIRKATGHFERVTKVDPDDANSWYGLAKCTVEPADQAKKVEYLEKAYKLNPNHRGIVYGLFLALGATDPDRAKKFNQRFEGLQQLAVESIKDIRYGDMGKYAEVIGSHSLQADNATGPIPLFFKDKDFQVHLAPGARWATAEDVRKGPEGELRAELRKRFGATLVVFDFDMDGKPDIFLLGAVVEGDKLRDLLLHNEGGGQFRDVTAAAGLAESWASIGCSAGDFNNDGFPDLFITGADRQRLFRNVAVDKKGSRRFEDVTAQAGLDKLTDVCLAASFVDLDQDGDLDLLVTRFAPDPARALTALRDGKAADGGVALFVNVGKAKQDRPSVDPEPLEPKFQRDDRAFKIPGPATGIVLSDLDTDRDIDALALGGLTPGTMILNDRLLQFHTEPLPNGLIDAGYTGGVVLDVTHADKSDLVLIGPGRVPALLLNKSPKPSDSPRFERGGVQGPPGLALLQAQAIDLDEDGWTDVVGLSETGKPVLLHNDGKGHLRHVEEGLGADAALPGKLVAVAVGDFIKERSDVLVWTEGTGLHLYANQGNGNHALRLTLVGHRKTTGASGTRSNAGGHGTRVVVQTDAHWTGLEYTTLTAVLNQSLQPLVLGLGKHTVADFIRLRWPDSAWQGEIGKAAGPHTIHEDNRKPDSCPVLFTWDGERYVFVADFLGAGAMGEVMPDRGHRPPRPEESVKIEAHQLRPKAGKYLLKVAEPMDEIAYLDRLQLVVVDHPAGVRVYPDERFCSGPPPSQDLLAFRTDQQVFPVRATTHTGADVTATLREWDRKTVSGFARKRWLGLAEEHAVTLDFGDRLAKFADGDRLLLCLAGWTDYTYPESEWAAAQAGVSALLPMLERRADDGTWKLIGEIGFPAGTPRMITLELTGKQLAGSNCVFRIRTNLHVHWDQIFLAPLLARGPKEGLFRATPLEVDDARLSVRGFMQEFSPDGREPTIYDHDRLENVPVTRWQGKLTRLGDVTDLLHQRDDRFVVMGPGDEIAVSFDAGKLPALPEGWTRSFVLRSWGYCKSAGPFTTTGGYVEPLPFHGMSNFPYRADEHYPRDAAHQEYLRRHQTRRVGPTR